MKVYLLIDHVCEADVPIGVFSAKELAQRCIDALLAKDKFGLEGPEIIEYELNSEPYSGISSRLIA